MLSIDITVTTKAKAICKHVESHVCAQHKEAHKHNKCITIRTSGGKFRRKIEFSFKLRQQERKSQLTCSDASSLLSLDMLKGWQAKG